jgi:CAAD domains of cyanobacterial aminoacyl-tRNA synthetase
MMDTQQLEYTNATSSQVDAPKIESAESANLAMLPPANNSNSQFNQIGDKISDFFQKLPSYLSQFYSEYKLPIISFALLVAGVTALKILVAAIDAINDIPLVSPLMELIGIAYTAWFTYRYLLKASTRQELVAQLNSIKKQFMGAEATETQS